jgi:deoxyhypusine synthase
MEREAVFVPSNDAQSEEFKGPAVAGYDFNRIPFDFSLFLESFQTTGFTATALGRAIEEVKRMRAWRNPDDPNQRCTIFLGYTSNMVSSGNRDIIRFLVKHRMVDVLVTTAGGIEEDFIKCLAPTYVIKHGASTQGLHMRKAGVNRIGNLMIANDNYCKFEDWVMPILDEMALEQRTMNTIFSPSKLIDRLGARINCEDSIYFHAHRNQIPVFCPAITDGSLGDMLYFHSYRVSSPFILDIVQDVRALNTCAVRAAATGMIILGGGLIKHHICNANLMRNGADFSVYINTAHEFDGSDAGASPDEAVSWGKIKVDAKPVKVCCDATVAFPLLVAATFAKEYEEHIGTLARDLGDSLYI